MPKADRILANLPPTFALRGDPSALRALVDAYGGELQTAENALVAVMRAHWVQFADAGESEIVDLALFAALYGLAPRADESVEEFRDHLRRYVRTHLEGTVTVRGILRITAEALGLHIEDEALDSWWDRGDPVLETSLPRGADAARLVLGLPEAVIAGRDAQRGTLVGLVELGPTVDLSGRHTLWVALDGGGAIPVDLRTGAADPAAVTPTELAAAIDAELGQLGIARIEAGRLALAAPSAGADSAVTVEDGPDDAADLVLGLLPRTYSGADPTHARLVGAADLSSAQDLTQDRYLRLVVDGDTVAEIDCAAAAADPTTVDVADITAAINAALGIPVASDDGRFLTLASPTPGDAGSLVLLDPAAQPATRRLFGDAPAVAVGTDARPARLVSDRPIGLGVNLRTDSVLRLAVDASPAVSIDVAGLDPAATTPTEIVAAVNEGLGSQSASHDGDRVSLVSPTDGAAGVLRVDDVDSDAAPSVLGLHPRTARGAPPATASLTGTADLSAGVDLSSRHLLVLRVDGNPAREVDLRAGVADPAHASVGELVDAVNAGLGANPDAPIATTDGAHLILVSTQPGAAGSIEVSPLRDTVRRRFVTRARVTDDAATAVLGFTARTAFGAPATSARLVGTNDLSGGADLSVDRYLRLTVGDGPATEIDCAGPRPRATTPAEIVERIVAASGPVAFTDGHTILLLDPQPGGTSRIAVEPPRSLDALDLVLGLPEGLVRGAAAAGVRFASTVDLSAGVELPADAALRLAVDGAPALDIPVGDGVASAVRPLSQLVAQVNFVLGAAVAGHDGTRLYLTSPSTGATSALAIEAPTAGTDVTAAVLGVTPVRTYAGRAATAAEVVGRVDLTGGADLRLAHLLRIAVDGAEPDTVDLTGTVPADERGSVEAATIAAAIRAATTAEAETASIPGGLAVVVRSPTTGLSSRLELLRPGAGDAAPLLFGAAGIVVTGEDPAAAVLDGAVDLLGPVDLSRRSVLRLAVDGGPPVDIDAAGITPNATLLGEIVAAIDDAVPGLAQVGPADRLRLVSPTTGPDSRVEVVPVRHLEVVEYPAARDEVRVAVAHGSMLSLASLGATDVPGRVEIYSAGGVASPRLSDPQAGWSVRVDAPVAADGRLVLEPTATGGVRAIATERGQTRVLDPELIEVVPALPSAGAAAALTVGRGRNRWSWTECDAARFDEAVFDGDQYDGDRFAGGACLEEAVFDVSRFSPTDIPAIFATAGPRPATAQVTVIWDSHTAGALEVHLPSDLDPRFGRAFGEDPKADAGGGFARFGSAEAELIAGVVTEPIEDDLYVVTLVNTQSRLIEAKVVSTVPIGWAAVALPFRDPAPLTLGRPGAEAKLYVSGPGLAPGFLELRAAEPGAYGNEIQVSARLAGPEIYDLEVSLAGARFENARAVVFGQRLRTSPNEPIPGPDLPTLADQLLGPSPIGVGTAKAAGIRADVTRDRVTVPVPTTHQDGPGPYEEGTP